MITDDELLLYHYRDGLDAAERARIGAALREQPDLARRLQSLVSRLDAAATLPDVPVPGDVQRRWQDALAQATHTEVTADARVMSPRRFDYRWPLAAAAAALILVVGMRIGTHSPPAPIAAATAPAPSAYERGLKWHLASTEQQLAGLGSATPEERARLIDAIVEQNRLYALAAERAGEPQLARVLRAFAPILENVAHDGGDATADLAQLSFELRVMQGRLSAGSKAGSGST
jgi:hypothetical protein